MTRASASVAASRRRSRAGVTTCAVCGTTFAPARADARTCSSACRQKAYRARLAGRPGLTIAELAARNPIVADPAALSALLRESEEMGIVERLPGGLFALTSTGVLQFGAALRCLQLEVPA